MASSVQSFNRHCYSDLGKGSSCDREIKYEEIELKFVFIRMFSF